MPFAPGAIGAGSSRGTPRSPPRPGPSWICMRAAGRAGSWVPGSTSSARTRRRASRRVGAGTRRSRPRPGTRCGSSMSTPAAVRGPTSRRGMSIGPRSSGGVNTRLASCPFAAWWPRSCARSPTARPPGCSGSWTTAPRIAETVRRAPPGRVAPARPRAHAGARQLAQPDRDLLLDRPTPSPHAQRLPQPHRRQGSPSPVSGSLRASGHPFQWTFTRRDLAVLLARLARTPRRLVA